MANSTSAASVVWSIFWLRVHLAQNRSIKTISMLSPPNMTSILKSLCHNSCCTCWVLESLEGVELEHAENIPTYTSIEPTFFQDIVLELGIGFACSPSSLSSSANAYREASFAGLQFRQSDHSSKSARRSAGEKGTRDSANGRRTEGHSFAKAVYHINYFTFLEIYTSSTGATCQTTSQGIWTNGVYMRLKVISCTI